jgi:hypothetical protein
MILLKLGHIPTFEDLYTKMGKYLIVPVYCLSETDVKLRKTVCSPKTTPDMSILDAVVLSCTIPVIFQKAMYRGKVYIDGAYASKFPIEVLQEAMLEASLEGCNILGIDLKSEETNLNTFLGYITSILMIPLQEQQHYNILPCTDIIEIITEKSASAINFSLSATEKMNLFSYGSKQIKNLVGGADNVDRPVTHTAVSTPLVPELLRNKEKRE